MEQSNKQTELTEIRINKYLSEAGVCSRRKADEYIEQGRVTIHGIPVEKGACVSVDASVEVDGVTVCLKRQRVTLAFYKPRGLVCSRNGQGSKTVADYLQYPVPLYYVGRLDKESEGLLLMTNDGDLANAISKARNGHEKEYEVTVNRPVTKTFIRRMAQGVPILDTVTRPCTLRRIDDYTFSIILTQGLNRQIRYMCRYFDYHVTKLKRVRIMNIRLGNLPVGKWRDVTAEELEALKKQFIENDRRDQRKRRKNR